MPAHIAHICLPPLTQAASSGSQKSAIAQRFIYLRSTSDVRNNELDIENFLELKAEGWYVLTIFACLVKSKIIDETLNNIVSKQLEFN